MRNGKGVKLPGVATGPGDVGAAECGAVTIRRFIRGRTRRNYQVADERILTKSDQPVTIELERSKPVKVPGIHSSNTVWAPRSRGSFAGEGKKLPSFGLY
jgi:hypothetical protein